MSPSRPGAQRERGDHEHVGERNPLDRSKGGVEFVVRVGSATLTIDESMVARITPEPTVASTIHFFE
jgi:hypothetical protein